MDIRKSVPTNYGDWWVKFGETWKTQIEQLKQDIGEVKDFGSIVTGSVSLSGGAGHAKINLKVIGDRKTVNASVDLVLVSGSSWRVSAASYVNDSGQTIDLLDPYDTRLLIPLLLIA